MNNFENTKEEPIDLTNPILEAKLHKLVHGPIFNNREGFQPFEFHYYFPTWRASMKNCMVLPHHPTTPFLEKYYKKNILPK